VYIRSAALPHISSHIFEWKQTTTPGGTQRRTVIISSPSFVFLESEMLCSVHIYDDEDVVVVVVAAVV